MPFDPQKASRLDFERELATWDSVARVAPFGQVQVPAAFMSQLVAEVRRLREECRKGAQAFEEEVARLEAIIESRPALN